MEEIGTTDPKYQPLQVLWHPFVHPCSKHHPHGTYLLIYQTNSTFYVSRIVDLKSFDIHYMSFLHAPYKLLPPNNFSLFLLSFSSHTFLWACGSSREPRKYFLNFIFVHFTCLSNNPLISAKLVSALLPCMLLFSA